MTPRGAQARGAPQSGVSASLQPPSQPGIKWAVLWLDPRVGGWCGGRGPRRTCPQQGRGRAQDVPVTQVWVGGTRGCPPSSRAHSCWPAQTSCKPRWGCYKGPPHWPVSVQLSRAGSSGWPRWGANTSCLRCPTQRGSRWVPSLEPAAAPPPQPRPTVHARSESRVGTAASGRITGLRETPRPLQAGPAATAPSNRPRPALKPEVQVSVSVCVCVCVPQETNNLTRNQRTALGLGEGGRPAHTGLVGGATCVGGCGQRGQVQAPGLSPCADRAACWAPGGHTGHTRPRTCSQVTSPSQPPSLAQGAAGPRHVVRTDS